MHIQCTCTYVYTHTILYGQRSHARFNTKINSKGGSKSTDGICRDWLWISLDARVGDTNPKSLWYLKYETRFIDTVKSGAQVPVLTCTFEECAVLRCEIRGVWLIIVEYCSTRWVLLKEIVILYMHVNVFIGYILYRFYGRLHVLCVFYFNSK